MAGLTSERGESLPDRRQLLPNYSAKKPLHLHPQEQRRFLTPGRNPSACRYPDGRRMPRCWAVKRSATHAVLPVRSAPISIYCPLLSAGCITPALDLHCTCT